MMEILIKIQSNPDFLYNCLAFLCGLLVHILNVLIQKGIGLKEYITSNAGRTFLSFSTLFGVFGTIAYMYPTAPYLFYFVSAYATDNLANKSSMSSKKALAAFIKAK
jgi:hypothetical protein